MSKTISPKPLRMWIDGTCFQVKRLEKMNKLKKTTIAQSESETACSTPLEDNKFLITRSENNVSTSFKLPSIYYIRLHRFTDFSLKTLEQETHTTISIPEKDVDGCIVISGENDFDVIKARHQLHSVIGELREKLTAAQFISIPVLSEEVQRNFEKFKQEILNGDPIDGVEESIFQSSLKLHLTIAVFALMNDSEKEEAVAALSACKTEVIEPLLATSGPWKIQVSGIDCMTENYFKANVLYANAKIVNDTDEDLLQKIANAILEYFYERGLVIQYKETVKLHVTLINTRYRRSSAQNTPKKVRVYYKKQPFNAMSIMNKYKDFCFGESVFDSLHLSCMSSVGEDGFYVPLSIIRF
ncbi:hypothetical protein RN001_007891 [Aquatica leii]|uniref:A-kinase anchor protein 7-like phosphoesterase domain-containing protein n=1 Tax=Aquatica leii TaxID=1421715 RepID=A0AAN7P3H8_9COLE|nr:hypothetical protein RN001_007891 [Aquatica leii]